MKNIKFKKSDFWDVSDKYIKGKVEVHLERCPFCGEVVEMEFNINKANDHAYVDIFCKECKLWQYRVRNENKNLYEIADELSEFWNRRP